MEIINKSGFFSFLGVSLKIKKKKRSFFVSSMTVSLSYLKHDQLLYGIPIFPLQYSFVLWVEIEVKKNT